jgi:hypothetical protein
MIDIYINNYKQMFCFIKGHTKDLPIDQIIILVSIMTWLITFLTVINALPYRMHVGIFIILVILATSMYIPFVMMILVYLK